MEVIKLIKDESLIFGKTKLEVDKSLDPSKVTSLVTTKLEERAEVNLGGWYVDIESPLSEKDKYEQDYIVLVETKAMGLQPFRITNPEVKKRRVFSRAYHVLFDSELYVVENYESSNNATLTVLNGLNDNLDRPSPFSYVVTHSGSTSHDFTDMTLFEAFEYLVDNKGAYIQADWYKIIVRNDLGEDRGVTISHGKDLEDITGTEDWSTVVTKIIPETSDGIKLPERYLTSDIQYNRPYTRKVQIDVDIDKIKEVNPDKSEEELKPIIQSHLRENAEHYLEKAKYPQVTYRVRSNVKEELNLWDHILVKHPAITINLPLEGEINQEDIDKLGIPTRVLAYTYDVLDKRTKEIDYGDFYANFNKIFTGKLDEIKDEWRSVEKNFEERLREQTDLINNWNKKGHMVIEENEIFFLDKLPKEEAEHVLKLGLGGIAFSESGVDGDFTSAWDLDGNFNTDFIGAGQIKVNHLSSDVGSSLDLSSNESINLLVENKVVEEIDNIELPPGPQGPKGDDGVGIIGSEVGYKIDIQGETPPEDGGWSSEVPTLTQSMYLWTRVKTEYSQGSPTYSYSVTYISKDGKDGAEIDNISTEFNLSSSKIEEPESGWTDTVPGWEKGKYLWTRTRIEYSDDRVEYTAGVVDSSWEILNDLRIGGRNYISHMEENWENGYFSTSDGEKIDPEDNEKYKRLKDFFRLDSDTGYVAQTSNVEMTIGVWSSTETFIGYHTVASNSSHFFETGPNAYFGSIYITNFNGNEDIQLNDIGQDIKLKLEKGNIPTDWTPSPEDIEEYTEKTASEKADDIWSRMDETLYGEDGESGLSQIIQENSSNIQITGEYIRDVVDVNIQGLGGEFSSLNETVQTATETISTIEGSLTSLQGDVTSTNETVADMLGDITNLSTTVTGVTGEVEEINTYFKRDQDGLTIGGTEWETKLVLDGEKLRFVNESSDVEASFGTDGMYVNKWQTDLHTIEKFEDGTYKATIFRDRRG